MIKIDIDTRSWQIPKEEAFLGVESDDKVKILQFELSKNEFCDGLNFTDCNCFINYKNEDNDTIPYGITDMELQEDGTVTFTWQVSRGATIFKGNTFAVLCAKKVREDGTITNEWNSRIGTFTVSKGIEPLSSITEVPEIDIISQLLSVAQQTNANAQNNINQSSQLLEKAEGLGYLKEDFDVLEARMNQFTSLKEGSTTGDAELQDIRVGSDGKTYDTAGDAVRGQIGELKGDIVKFKNDVSNYIEPKNLLNPNNFEIGYSINMVSGSESPSEKHVIWRNIPAKVGRTIYLSRGNLTQQTPNPLACYKKDGTYISTIDNGGTIPEETAYMKLGLSLATYNAWKKSLQLEYDEITSYEAWFEPFYKIDENKLIEINNKISELNSNQTENNNKISELNNAVSKRKLISNKCCLSIAHQGYSTTSQYYGNSRIESFINASKFGFDYAETDLYFSSDEVAICCHDASFVDGTSGETVYLSQHTAQELKAYNYYGGTISTFDEVVKTCKENGIGLVIDHVTEADSGNRFSDVMATVSKYQMQDNVIWHVGRESMVNTLNTWYSKVRIYVPIANVTDVSTILDLYRRFATDNNEIGFSVNVDKYTVDDIISLASELPARVHIMCWTIDDKDIYRQYLPYVNGIISNKISTYLL